MIAVDVGSKLIKWFDGSSFGVCDKESFKFPASLKGAVIGVTSKSVFVKKAVYPVCKVSALKKLILNDISSDMMVSPEQISVAFCVLKREKAGCEVLIFVEKKEHLEEKKLTDEYRILTLDLVGGISAVSLVYEGDEFSYLDVGASKTAVVNFADGRLKSVDVLRVGGGFLKREPSYLKERLLPLIGSKNVIVSGGGALDGELIKLMSQHFEIEIPTFSPFGEKTPLYFNAFGLFNLKKSPCPASFSETSLLRSDFFEKHKKEILFASISLGAGISFFLLSQFLQYVACRQLLTKEENLLKTKLEKVLGEKVVAPDIQLSQAISNLKEEKKFFGVSNPSALFVLRKISDAVIPGIRIYKVKGSVYSDSFNIKGYADSEKDFGTFVNNLKKRFKNVSNVSTSSASNNSIKFSLTVSGVKSGV